MREYNSGSNRVINIRTADSPDALPFLGRVKEPPKNKPIKRFCLACGEMRPSSDFRGECCGPCNKPGSGERLLRGLESAEADAHSESAEQS